MCVIYMYAHTYSSTRHIRICISYMCLHFQEQVKSVLCRNQVHSHVIVKSFTKATINFTNPVILSCCNFLFFCQWKRTNTIAINDSTSSTSSDDSTIAEIMPLLILELEDEGPPMLEGHNTHHIRIHVQ